MIRDFMDMMAMDASIISIMKLMRVALSSMRHGSYRFINYLPLEFEMSWVYIRVVSVFHNYFSETFPESQSFLPLAKLYKT